VQFSRTAEQEWAHVTDRRRLVAVDGLALDTGTSTGDAGSLDTEDYAVLFELDRLRALHRGVAPAQPPTYDLIMLDEAQELAPLELALVGRSLAPGGTLVVAGDPAQQIDPGVTFTSWEDTLRELGCVEHDTVTLEVGYRCPPEVVSLAHHVLDGATAAPAGTSVFHAAFPDEVQLAAWIARELAAVSRRDRTATSAVICRSPLFARRLVERLRAGVPARLVLDGQFLARGGVQVTTVDQVRGLEFDNVVVPDATAATYPEQGAARRALYVAVTRARHQLVVASVGERTRLLPAR
jgi:superfamily I DNA/RNA helicase